MDQKERAVIISMSTKADLLKLFEQHLKDGYLLGELRFIVGSRLAEEMKEISQTGSALSKQLIDEKNTKKRLKLSVSSSASWDKWAKVNRQWNKLYGILK